MQGADTEVVQRIVQHRHVTETDDPLRVLQQGRKVDVLHELHGTVAAARAPDGLYRRVLDRSLQIGGAFQCGTGLLKVLAPDA